MSNSNVIHLTATEDVPLSFTEIGSFIARLRLILRPTVAARDRARDEARCLRAEIQALKDTCDPVHARQITELEQQVPRLEADDGRLDGAIREDGYAPVRVADKIGRRTALAERCDLLNINTANREGLSEIRRNGCAHL
jgi:hypothetical protein